MGGQPGSAFHNHDAKTLLLQDIGVKRVRIPDTLLVGEELGKGANNRVRSAQRVLQGNKNQPCVLRVPRRKSDTQQTDSALWEVRYTLRAAQLGAAPALFDAWWSKHAHGEWPSGLYLVSERLSLDMDTLLTEHPREVFAEYIESIGRESIECVKRLAYDRLFVYDLKPSNMMVRLMEDGEAHVRVIDFGREFCEWDVEGADTSVIDMLRREGCTDDTRISHILFAFMLIQLASTTTRRLREDRRSHRMDAEERFASNPFVRYATELLDGMRGCDIALVRRVLRHDSVKGVMQHYLSRRDAGTRRVFRCARGIELATKTPVGTC